MKRLLYVLRRPSTAFGPAAYYPPGATVPAKWADPEAVESFHETLADAPAWTAMPEKEAKRIDAADAKAQSRAAIRAALSEEAEKHGQRKIDETPGDLMFYQSRRDGDFVLAPVVVLRRIPSGPAAGYVAKVPDGALVHFPADWPMEAATLDAWFAALRKWNGAGGAS